MAKSQNKEPLPILLSEFQCFAGTSFFAIAIKLACLASDANKS